MEYINLGLPSGNLWASENEEGFYTFDEAVDEFGNNIPSHEDWEELIAYTTQEWDDTLKGTWLTSRMDSNKIFLPAAGNRLGTHVSNAGIGCHYWSSSHLSSIYAFSVDFGLNYLNTSYNGYRFIGRSIRLIKR